MYHKKNNKRRNLNEKCKKMQKMQKRKKGRRENKENSSKMRIGGLRTCKSLLQRTGKQTSRDGIVTCLQHQNYQERAEDKVLKSIRARNLKEGTDQRVQIITSFGESLTKWRRSLTKVRVSLNDAKT